MLKMYNRCVTVAYLHCIAFKKINSLLLKLAYFANSDYIKICVYLSVGKKRSTVMSECLQLLR